LQDEAQPDHHEDHVPVDVSTQHDCTAEPNGSQELTEKEIEDFIENERKAASQGNNADITSVYTPQIGMEFKDRHDAHYFFAFHGFLAGFMPIVTHVTRTTARCRKGEVIKVTMKCHCYGKPNTKQTVEEQEASTQADIGKRKGRKRKRNVQVRTNCPVAMVVRESNGIWKVARLDLDHNHPLTPEDRDLLFSGQKYMTEMERAMIRTLSHNNIPTRKMIAILSHLRGGVTALPYKKKDVSNYRTKINREVTGTDMSQVLSYFMERKNQDPTFFYKIDVDEDKRLKNLFWADGSAIKYYAEYGDFVSFDTTHMTNRYNLPFAPFVGVTGHAQTCVFGCAFLHDQTVGTFKWVFEAFVEAMNGKHPKTIITDQDNAIKAAIKIVFPDAVHRNCLFHIKNKCYSKNGKVFANNEGLMEEFEDTVNNSLTTTEFEYLWTKMIADYKLENNNYFTRMWETRERFIPVYYKNEFFPFLHTTTRSETTNARFKDNVGPTYSMISFMKEYQRIVDTIDRTEAEEDTKSRQKQCKELLFDYQIEQQAQKMYNRNIFKKF